MRGMEYWIVIYRRPFSDKNVSTDGIITGINLDLITNNVYNLFILFVNNIYIITNDLLYNFRQKNKIFINC
jgi:hypothetical protein